MTGIEVAFDNNAVDAGDEPQLLIDAATATVQFGARLSARYFGLGARSLSFGLLEFAARNHARRKQLTLPRQTFLCELRVNRRLRRVGLCLPEVGRGHQREDRTCFDTLSDIGANSRHSPGECRKDSLRARFIPGQPCRQIDGHGR